jgi:hypothetical protein
MYCLAQLIHFLVVMSIMNRCELFCLTVFALYTDDWMLAGGFF